MTKRQTVYPVIEGWDIQRILSLAPNIDSIIRVLDFEGIPCSVYGSPLILMDGKYAESDKRYNKKQQEVYRSRGRIINIAHANNIMKQGTIGNRYLIATEKEGKIKPIMEVTNHGRSILRCKQWAKILKLAFDENTDILELDSYNYNQFLKELQKKIII